MKRYKEGFTLIELLIAILMFSIIASVIYSTFSTGTSVWKRTKDATRVSNNINSVLEELAGNLRNSVKYKGLEFTGEEDTLYFCYLADTMEEEERYTEIYRASYYAIRENGKYNLFRRTAPLAKGGFDIDDIDEKKLIDGLDEFKIEYALKETMGDIIWEVDWDKEKKETPAALRMKIHKGDITFTKYIQIPTGRLVDSETD